jgi:hypothetical protein
LKFKVNTIAPIIATRKNANNQKQVKNNYMGLGLKSILLKESNGL